MVEQQQPKEEQEQRDQNEQQQEKVLLTESDKQLLRSITNKKLQQLQNHITTLHPSNIPHWKNGRRKLSFENEEQEKQSTKNIQLLYNSVLNDTSSNECKFLNYCGFLIIPNFCNNKDSITTGSSNNLSITTGSSNDVATQATTTATATATTSDATTSDFTTTIDECTAMKQQMYEWVENYWNIKYEDDNNDDDDDDDDNNFMKTNNNFDTFGTSANENIKRSNYFLDSSDKVHFFAEPSAVIEKVSTVSNNDNKKKTVVLKSQYRTSTSTSTSTNNRTPINNYNNGKIVALNKIGHGIHISNNLNVLFPNTTTRIGTRSTINKCTNNIFYNYCTSTKIKNLLVDKLQYNDPVIPQSMYILKHPSSLLLSNSNSNSTSNSNSISNSNSNYNSTGVVYSHQDSTFLYTTPYQTCIGLWLPLDNTTLDNGCLWIRPHSHLYEPTRRHYQNISNTDTDTDTENKNDEPKFYMNELYNYTTTVPWDGGLPGDSTSDGTISIEDNNESITKEEQEQIKTLPKIIQNLIYNNFIPIECNAGDLIIFLGDVDHLSLSNITDSTSSASSSSSRHTFQLHIIDTKCTFTNSIETVNDNGNIEEKIDKDDKPTESSSSACKIDQSETATETNTSSVIEVPIVWSPLNWLQYTDNKKFLRILDYHS